jgi:hypothetical protein
VRSSAHTPRGHELSQPAGIPRCRRRLRDSVVPDALNATGRHAYSRRALDKSSYGEGARPIRRLDCRRLAVPSPAAAVHLRSRVPRTGGNRREQPSAIPSVLAAFASVRGEVTGSEPATFHRGDRFKAPNMPAFAGVLPRPSPDNPPILLQASLAHPPNRNAIFVAEPPCNRLPRRDRQAAVIPTWPTA